MNELNSKRSISFTSEEKEKRKARNAVCMIFGVSGLLLVVFGVVHFLGWIDFSNQQELQAADQYYASIACIILGCLSFALPISLLYCTTCGEWRLDQSGVSFHPLRGEEVSLKWEEIERVKWQGDCAILKGTKKNISIPWFGFNKSFRKEVVVLIKSQLEPAFDFSFDEHRADEHRAFSFERNARSISKFVAKVVAVVIISLLPLLGWLITFYPYVSLPTWVTWLGCPITVWTFFFPVIYAMFLNRAQLRKRYSWRLRENFINED